MKNGDNEFAAADRAERAIALGRKGLGRAEIAAALDVGLAELVAMEARSLRFAQAMRRAAELERAWWEAQPREALAAGARLDVGAWREVMRWRFGAADGAAGGRPAAAVAEAQEPARPRTIYLLPDNGMELGPDMKPRTVEERRARSAAPVKEKIERLERELAQWRETLSEVEAWYDEDEDEDEEEDAWDEDDWEEAEDEGAGDADGSDHDRGEKGEVDRQADDTDGDDDDGGRKVADGEGWIGGSAARPGPGAGGWLSADQAADGGVGDLNLR